jgi:hypothetical protein
VLRDEIFGPVLCVRTFETDEEAIALAVRKTYFLSCFWYKNDYFYQDRLGTNIGKAQKCTVGLRTTRSTVSQEQCSRELLRPPLCSIGRVMLFCSHAQIMMWAVCGVRGRNDPQRCAEVTNALKVGCAWINCTQPMFGEREGCNQRNRVVQTKFHRFLTHCCVLPPTGNTVWGGPGRSSIGRELGEVSRLFARTAVGLVPFDYTVSAYTIATWQQKTVEGPDRLQ